MEKISSGIKGLDAIMDGGLPKGKTTYAIGQAGCGKTMLAMQFLYSGAESKEAGLFISFEETKEDLIDHFENTVFDLKAMMETGLLTFDAVFFNDNAYTESEAFTLEGLMIRLDYLIKKTQAKRVVLDSFKALFERFGGPVNFRFELTRLIAWLKKQGVTTLITGSDAGNGLGVEAYVVDCVLLLDQRVKGQLSTRRLRVLKYRGSKHESNEYPYTITEGGFVLTPLSSLSLNHEVLRERISTGIESLDTMFENKGYYRGASILISGEAGAGKSSLAAHFLYSLCKKGRKGMLFQFEESESQIIRNMRSIGLDLEPFVEQGLLKIHSVRPTHLSLESHLLNMFQAVDRFQPDALIMDPISSFWSSDEDFGIKSLMTRIIDYLKTRQVTGMFTHLMHGTASLEAQNTMISSLIDTWIVLRNREKASKRVRDLFIVKSRGMAHETNIHPFRITHQGFMIERDRHD
ncbi:MAG: circadian clock protein KaiC [Bacillota bacterium]